MTKEELERQISQTEQLLAELKEALEDELKHPKFRRLPIGDFYYTIETSCDGFTVKRGQEAAWILDNQRFYSNNYFYTKERANEVADKIKFLLKLERYYDTYCGDCNSDWESEETTKYYISFDPQKKKFAVCSFSFHPDIVDTCFPNREIAQKVCDSLNDELIKFGKLFLLQN